MESVSYKVKTAVFEGPLDLLLELVSKRKLFINDVSLAEVTDDFIRYLEEHDDFPLAESAEFVLVASTLMLIKSRSLLPQISLSEEEEESIEDLESRLNEYARVKALAQELSQLVGRQVIYEKTPSRIPLVVFSPDKECTLAGIHSALLAVVASLPKKESLPEVRVKKIMSLEEMIDRLTERISQASQMNFSELHGEGGPVTKEKKVSIIVGFLAMLELVKRGVIRVTQEEGGEMTLSKEAQ